MFGKEKRRFPRVPYKDLCHIEFFLHEKELTQDFESVRDLSFGGVAIETNREIPVGSKLFIHFGTENKTPIQVKGKVVYSRALDQGNFVLGVQFLSISPRDRTSLEEVLQKYGVES